MEEDHGHKYSGGKSGKAKTYEPTYFPSYFPTYQPTPPKYPTLETRDPTPRPTPQPTPQPMPQPTRRPTSNPSQAPNPVISVPVINPDFIDSYAGQRAHISVLDNDIPATGTTLHVQTIAKGTEYPTSYPTFFPVSFILFLGGCTVYLLEANPLCSPPLALLIWRYNYRRYIPPTCQRWGR